MSQVLKHTVSLKVIRHIVVMTPTEGKMCQSPPSHHLFSKFNNNLFSQYTSFFLMPSVVPLSFNYLNRKCTAPRKARQVKGWQNIHKILMFPRCHVLHAKINVLFISGIEFLSMALLFVFPGVKLENISVIHNLAICCFAV